MTTATQARLKNAAHAAALAAAAVLVRLWGLGEQSLAWDDYNGLVGLSEDSLLASVALARQVNPEGAPLYHVVQWLASLIIGTSPPAMRLLSVALGLAALPLVYATGARVFGRRAGLIAAWCLALSPLHIYHDQSIRNYPLYALLGAAALYTQIRCLQDGERRWLAANWLSNTLLVWTHLLGVFFVAAQGVVWLSAMRRRRTALLWGAVQALLLLPLLGWVATMPHVPDTGYWHFHAPDALRVAAGLAMPDFVRTTPELNPAGDPWRVSLGGLSTDGPAALWAMGAVMSLCFGGGMAAWAVWRARRGGRPPGSPDPDAVAALLACALLPGIALALVSHGWRPMYYQRYLLPSTLPLYLLAGGALSVLVKPRGLRIAALALLAMAGLQQLSLTLPCVMRTPWAQAARKLVQESRPGDQVLVGGFGDGWTNLRLLAANLPVCDLPAAPAHTLDAAVIKTAMRLCPDGGGGAPVPEGGCVWYLSGLLWGRTRLDGLDEHLRAVGFEVARQDLVGDEGIAILRVSRGDRTPSTFAEVCSRYWDRIPDPGRTLSGLNLREVLDRFGVTEDRNAFLRQLRMVYDDGDLPEAWPDRMEVIVGMLDDEGAPNTVALLANSGDGDAAIIAQRMRTALLRGDVSTAAAGVRSLLDAIPRELTEDQVFMAPLLMTAASILGMNGERGDARALLERAAPPPDGQEWRVSLAHLLAEGDTAAARKAVRELRARIPSPLPDIPPPLLCAMGLPDWVVPAGEAALCGP
ncbi:MAG TPA: glycosyltransferase family 39 protein [Candidatus Hydrogenedentes bacterium]|nr:glycosyltransferase family 39 protein [Candidatus Hydrogenedentota bacterium]